MEILSGLSRPTILDAGGGIGNWTIFLAQKGYDIVLLDISPESLKIAEQRANQTGVSFPISSNGTSAQSPSGTSSQVRSSRGPLRAHRTYSSPVAGAGSIYALPITSPTRSSKVIPSKCATISNISLARYRSTGTATVRMT